MPEQKRVDIGLTYIFGIGRSNVKQAIKEANVDGAKRVKDLTEEERWHVINYVNTFMKHK